MNIKDMTNRTKVGLVAATVLLLGAAGVGSALATTTPVVPVNNPANPVYACISPTGQVDYLEYRGAQPHKCFFKGERLWELSAGTSASAPTPSPSASVTPTSTPTG